MSRQIDPPASDDGGLRTAWIVLTILFTVMLIFQAIRWARGGGQADSMLVPATFLVMGLAHLLRLRGAARRIMLIVSAILAALALVLLFIR